MNHLIGYLTSHLPGRALVPRDGRDAGHTELVVVLGVVTAVLLLLFGIAVPIAVSEIFGDR